MPRTFASVPTHVYRERSVHRDEYRSVTEAEVPQGIKWNPPKGGAPADHRFTVLYSFGKFYKLVRDRQTGEVVYFQRKDMPAGATPKEKIDAEPPKPKQVRYREGTNAWWVDNGRWFLIKVVKRTQNPDTIIISSVTGWDADKQKEWPLGLELEFPANGQLFKRLRPLKARYV